MSGKGSAPRPFSVSHEEYENRWDAIFGRDKPKAPEPIVEGELPQEDQDEDNDDDDGDCPVCGTELYRSPTSSFLTCDICGYKERMKGEEP